MYNIYIIQSEKNNSYYIGQTNDLERRIDEHNRGKDKYTRNKTPWKLVYKENFENRNEAIKRESGIKKKKSRSYIEWLIKNSAG